MARRRSSQLLHLGIIEQEFGQDRKDIYEPDSAEEQPHSYMTSLLVLFLLCFMTLPLTLCES